MLVLTILVNQIQQHQTDDADGTAVDGGGDGDDVMVVQLLFRLVVVARLVLFDIGQMVRKRLTVDNTFLRVPRFPHRQLIPPKRSAAMERISCGSRCFYVADREPLCNFCI